MKSKDYKNKISTREECISLTKREKQCGAITGFTSGAFDLMHIGHIDFLFAAKELCDFLVVGINSDKSVQLTKGPNRPIISEGERLLSVAGLSCVDKVFLYDEKCNETNLRELQPEIYIKGPDYTNKPTNNQKLIVKLSGRFEIAKPEIITSTTEIIEKILITQMTDICTEDHIYNGLVLIDRDGVINIEKHYMTDYRDVEIIPNAAEGVKLLNELNYAVVIVTNQQGIGIGLATKEQITNINREIIMQIHKTGAKIDKIYVCPDTHSKSVYKKPNPGMINKALQDIKLIPDTHIYMIGDRKSDADAAKNTNKNIISIGVKTGKGMQDNWNEGRADYIVDNLYKACKLIYKREVK